MHRFNSLAGASCTAFNCVGYRMWVTFNSTLGNKRCTQQETRLRKDPNEHTALQNMVRVAVYARNNVVLIFTPTSAVYTHNTCADRHRRPGPNTQGLEQT